LLLNGGMLHFIKLHKHLSLLWQQLNSYCRQVSVFTTSSGTL